MEQTTGKSSAVLFIVSWLFVGIPAGWGVYRTVQNSAKLFETPHATSSPAQPR